MRMAYLLAVYDNAKYIQRGMDLAITYDSSWDDELEQANDSKRGLLHSSMHLE